MIIGQPKTLDEVTPLAPVQIDDFLNAAEGVVQQGVPFEVPTAIQVGLFAQLAITVKKYRAIAEKIPTMKEHFDALQDEAVERLLDEMLEEANKLLSLESDLRLAAVGGAGPQSAPPTGGGRIIV